MLRITALSVVLPCCLLTLGRPLVAQPLVPAGGEFQVNTTTTDFQVTPALAMAADGSFVVVWESRGQDGSGTGLFVRRYDAAGGALGGEMQVNTYTTGDQGQAAVTTLVDGGFVVAWSSPGGGGIGEVVGEDGDGLGIQSRRFDAAGMAVGGEVQVNTFTTGRQELPALVRRGDDGLVVVWQSAGADGSLDGIRARRLDATGSPVGGEVQVNSYTPGDQRRPAVAATADGGFVVAWDSAGSPGDSAGTGVVARRFAAAGTPVGDDFQVNATTAHDQQQPRLASAEDGRFLVVWQQATGGSDLDIYGRRFTAAGAAAAGEFRIDPGLAGNQARPVVTADTAGNWLVAWESDVSAGADSSQTSVQARLVGPGGALIGDAFQVNTYTPNYQYAAAVAGSGGDEFVVSWSNFETIGEGPPPTNDNRGVQAQRYALTAAEVAVPAESFGVGGETVAVAVSLDSASYAVASIAFSLDYDETCLDFDATDDDMDGLPDALDFATPPDFDRSVFFDAGDTDGELDVLIADVPPDLALADELLVTAHLGVTCFAPPGGTLSAAVAFSGDPAPSFGNTGGAAVAGRGRAGVVTILPGPRGDCNGDAGVDAADVGALGLELFDGDGSGWLAVPGSTFAGNPAGCDANGDTGVDAGDVSCTARRIFASPCDGDPPPGHPLLSVPRFVPVSAGVATAELSFAGDGLAVTSVVASLDVDPARLVFDPTDTDMDGVPDSVRIVGASPATVSVVWDPADTDGELDLLLGDTVASPTAFVDGVLVEIDFEPVGGGPSVDGGVVFATDPGASFGDLEGRALAGDAEVSEPILFADGFESGDVSAWSGSVP